MKIFPLIRGICLGWLASQHFSLNEYKARKSCMHALLLPLPFSRCGIGNIKNLWESMDIIGELNTIASCINFQRGSLDFRNGNHNFLLVAGGKPRVCCDGDDIDDNRVRLIPGYSQKKKKSSITRDGSGLLREGCAIDLVGQKIRMENTSAKTSEQIDKLIKRDWQHLGLDKSEKKSMRDGLSGYVKAGKKNELRRTNCLARMGSVYEQN